MRSNSQGILSFSFDWLVPKDKKTEKLVN